MQIQALPVGENPNKQSDLTLFLLLRVRKFFSEFPLAVKSH
jgi:hypothetical protein